MLTLPEIVEREAQTYAFINFTVRMDEMKKPADEGFPRLFSTLAQQGIAPLSAPFYNYRRIDMANTLDVEAGVPVARKGHDTGDVHFGELPGGKFVTLDWYGHYDRLERVTAMLIGWTRLVGVDYDMEARSDGDHFACRLEIYETDPTEVRDPEQWLTRLAFKVRG